MKFVRIFPCIAGIACCAFASGASAGTIIFPAADPAFLFDLPDGWTEQPKPASAEATVYLSKDSDASILFHTPPRNYTVQEAMTELPAIVRQHFEKRGVVLDLKPPHLAPAGQAALHGIPFVWMLASSSSNGVRLVYSFFLFTTPAGKTFIIEQIVPADGFMAHRDEFRIMLESVGPVD